MAPRTSVMAIAMQTKMRRPATGDAINSMMNTKTHLIEGSMGEGYYMGSYI